jgi:DNA invertase Pin-like site-specific DNA recombinase
VELPEIGRHERKGVLNILTIRFSVLAQFERRLIQERTRAGLAAARARGKQGGRKPRHAEESRVRIA